MAHFWWYLNPCIYFYRWVLLLLGFLLIYVHCYLCRAYKPLHSTLFGNAGMPGSCQDLIVIRKSPLWAKLVQFRPNEYFDQDQYILGDSGYMNVPRMVSSFKRTDSKPDKEAFNMCIAKCHITNELCIGVLKFRWHSLKEMRSQLKTKKDFEWTMRWINMCARLHNYVIDMNDEWTDEDQHIVLDREQPDLQRAWPPILTRAARRHQAATGADLLQRVMATTLEFNR